MVVELILGFCFLVAASYVGTTMALRGFFGRKRYDGGFETAGDGPPGDGGARRGDDARRTDDASEIGDDADRTADGRRTDDVPRANNVTEEE